MLTRRQLLGAGPTAVLAGGTYVAAADQRVDVPGAARVRRQLGACGDDPGLPVGVTDPELQTGLLPSEFSDGPAE